MKIKLIIAMLAISSIGGISAKELTADQALARVRAQSELDLRDGADGPRLVDTQYTREGTPAFYHFTFSGSKGFILAAADDAVAPLIGYSPAGEFTLKNMPDNLKSWMAYYADCVMDAKGLEPYPVLRTRAGEKAPISPLLKTTWDQTSPYNRLCPVVDGRLSVTGCVATAMAQVLKYWEYPPVGKDSISYRLSYMDEDLTMNFEATPFNWDMMLDSYGSVSSSQAMNSVATLMKACGYSVKMNYKPTESGAYSKEIPGALINYFGYDQGVRRVQRNAYNSDDEWDDLIYSELASIGPVIYSGMASSGSHCFVADGYDGKGYFHINWGWGGMSDGYFKLGELNPRQVGTGGHYGGYNTSQEAVIGIMPPVGRLTVENIGVANAADDSGNVKGWGYTYRINDFSNIVLYLDLKIAGGHLSSPLYYTVYDTDPETKKNKEIVLESTFDESLNAGDGSLTCSTRVRLDNYDPAKLYTVNVAYDLKGQRTTIGSIRMAASSGVDEVVADTGCPALVWDGRTLIADGDSEILLTVYNIGGGEVKKAKGMPATANLSELAPGVYIATARNAEGVTTTLRLLLK